MLGVQRDDALAGLPHIAQQELQKEALTLAGVAEDQGAGVGLVRRAAVQVYDDVGAEAVTSDKEAVGICFAGIIHGIQICNAPGGKHPLGKVRELLSTRGIGGEEAIPLAQGQRVGAHTGADELGGDGIPRRSQFVCIGGGNVHVDRAVDERLFFLALFCHHLRHVPQICLRGDALLDVVGIASLHAAFVGGGMENSVLLGGRNLPRRQAQVNAAHIPNAAQQRQLVGDRRVAFQGQRRMIPPTQNEMVRIEFRRGRRDHVQKVLWTRDLLRRFLFLLRFFLSHAHTPLRRDPGRIPWSGPAGSRSPAGA